MSNKSLQLTTFSVKDLTQRKVVIFGAGGFGRNAFSLLEKHDINIHCFIDNNQSLHGECLYGKPIMSIDSICHQNPRSHLIIVANSYYSEVKSQLTNLGFREGKDFVNAIAFSIEEEHLELKDRLWPFHNLHKGQRAFLIGNGPSLEMKDLDLLKNEITFAANRIYLAYDKTDWRPSYYCVCDPLVSLHNKEKIKQLESIKFLANSTCFYGEEINNGFVLPYYYRNTSTDLSDPHFSTNPIQGIYDGGTVIYMMMQLAFYMGISELYLIGVDHNFVIKNDSQAILTGEGENNHFDKAYRPYGETWSKPDCQFIERAFSYSKEFLENNNRSVYNVSRQSKLRSFEMLNLETVLAPHRSS